MAERAQQHTAEVVRRRVEDWAERVRGQGGRAGEADLEELLAAVRGGRLRQRLLYLHAGSPSIRSPLVGTALHEPVAGSLTQIDPLAPELPYTCVHDAILDGWRVIHFPLQTAPFEDREIDIMGYEFVLEKMEVYDG
ncbi:MAG: hypothetical protein IT369_03670 [Candidatus Latescibacteria bacterium]|nr:hypothetical protein [Candidatus Latescibacterota bacterium]